jgi:DNA-binding MarR family transcriptional regulator
MVSRQNLSGVVSRMERDGHLKALRPMARDRRSRLVSLTEYGRQVWVRRRPSPRFSTYYDKALAGFSDQRQRCTCSTTC